MGVGEALSGAAVRIGFAVKASVLIRAYQHCRSGATRTDVGLAAIAVEPLPQEPRTTLASSRRPPRSPLPAISLIVRPLMSRLFRVGNQPSIALQTITVIQNGIERHQFPPKPDVAVVSFDTRGDDRVRERSPIKQIQLASSHAVSPRLNQPNRNHDLPYSASARFTNESTKVAAIRSNTGDITTPMMPSKA